MIELAPAETQPKPQPAITQWLITTKQAAEILHVTGMEHAGRRLRCRFQRQHRIQVVDDVPVRWKIPLAGDGLCRAVDLAAVAAAADDHLAAAASAQEQTSRDRLATAVVADAA